MAELNWTVDQVRVGDADLVVERAGSGPPLLLLHEELGCPGTTEWQVEVAKTRSLIQVHHPGFNRTESVQWISSMRDLACFYAWFLREQNLSSVDVIGFSLGGWIAAEMAANNPSLFSKIVLVGAAGIQPPAGEIMDLFMITADEYLRRSVIEPSMTDEFGALYGIEQTPEQYEAFEEARAETARLAWKPYMFNHSLPNLLEAVNDVPTLIVWGEKDEIIPISVGERYRAAIPGSKLVTISGSGHRPEIENKEKFLEVIKGFLE